MLLQRFFLVLLSKSSKKHPARSSAANLRYLAIKKLLSKAKNSLEKVKIKGRAGKKCYFYAWCKILQSNAQVI